MTPAEFKEARKTLGLTAAELARIMGYGDRSRVFNIESGNAVPPQAMRLMQAYVDGYRPDDWLNPAFQEAQV